MGYGFRLRFVGYVWGFEASIRAECFGASIVRCMIGRSIFRLGFFGCRLGMIRSRFLVLILDYLEVYWFCIRVYFCFAQVSYLGRSTIFWWHCRTLISGLDGFGVLDLKAPSLSRKT